jgi:hypothetical protein
LIWPFFSADFIRISKGKCGELLFGKALDPDSPMFVSAPSENVACFTSIDKSLDRNRSNGCVENIDDVVRLLNDRPNVTVYVPET